MRQYNILSNYTITKHHYDKPENRTKIIDDVLNKSIKLKKVFLNNNKDYDIMTNKFKILNKEKKETDLEIKKNFYKSKEIKKYKQNLEENKQKILNTKRDTIFNLVSHEIFYKEKLSEKELKNQIHKLRYKSKLEIENYNQKNYKKELKEDSYLNNKLSNYRFKVQNKKRFNILTKENTYKKYKNKVKFNEKNEHGKLFNKMQEKMKQFLKRYLSISL